MPQSDRIINNDQYLAVGQVVTEHNKLVQDFAYFLNHLPKFQVAAAAVAPPVCARGTTASKVKTTATSQFSDNQVIKSLTATDDLWTLTGGNLAAGFCRRYWLLWDGTSATTVVSVQQSSDISIAVAGSAAAAINLCRWPALPPMGTIIVGILSIANTTNAFIPGTTLLSATGVTDTYQDSFDQYSMSASIVGA